MKHPAVERELDLLKPVIRADASCLEDFLHQDFVEIGASGRVWTRQEIIAALLADPTCPQDVRDIVAAQLADGLALITYELQGVRRSSIWMREAGTWRIRFHQGTRLIVMSENR